MPAIIRAGLFHAVTMLFLALTALIAQEPPAASSAAPVPVQIAAAKRAFIANGGGENSPLARDGRGSWFSGGPDRAYNQFYAAMKIWGRHELVPTPTDADLVFEISFSLPGSSQADAGRFRLSIIDPKTRTLLWALTERVAPFARQKTGDRNYDQALAYLVQDLKNLVARSH